MKTQTYAVTGLLACLLTVGCTVQQRTVPSLDELAGDWQRSDEIHIPSAIANFHGSAVVLPDILATNWLVFPPLAMAGKTGQMSINGQPVLADEIRWFPHQVLRRKKTGSLAIETAVRMVFENQGVLHQARFTNTGNMTQTLEVAIKEEVDSLALAVLIMHR